MPAKYKTHAGLLIIPIVAFVIIAWLMKTCSPPGGVVAMQNLKGEPLMHIKWSGGGPPGINNLLLLYADGQAVYQLTAPISLNPDHREDEAGYYLTQLKPDEIARFVKTARHDLAKLKIKPLVPDQVLVTATFRDQEPELRKSLADEAMPAKMRQSLKNIITQIREHPQWTVQLRLENTTAGEMKTVFKNRGQVEVQIISPWGGSQADSSQTNLIMDALPARMTTDPGYFPSAEDDKLRWLSVEAGERKPAAFLTLGPGETAEVVQKPGPLLTAAQKEAYLVTSHFAGLVKPRQFDPVNISVYSNQVTIGK